MSIENINWALNITGISATQKLVLLVLAHRSDGDDKCWPSYTRLVKDTCLARSTVFRTLSSLIELGLVEKVSVGDPEKRTATTYRLVKAANPPDKLIAQGNKNLLQRETSCTEKLVAERNWLHSETQSSCTEKLVAERNWLHSETQSSCTERPKLVAQCNPKDNKKDHKKDHSTCGQQIANAIIALPTRGGGTVPITDDLIAEWKVAYPEIDILAELRKMRAWLVSNPQKAKTARGMKRFVNSWLSRVKPHITSWQEDNHLQNQMLLSYIADEERKLAEKRDQKC